MLSLSWEGVRGVHSRGFVASDRTCRVQCRVRFRANHDAAADTERARRFGSPFVARPVSSSVGISTERAPGSGGHPIPLAAIRGARHGATGVGPFRWLVTVALRLHSREIAAELAQDPIATGGIH